MSDFGERAQIWSSNGSHRFDEVRGTTVQPTEDERTILMSLHLFLPANVSYLSVLIILGCEPDRHCDDLFWKTTIEFS